MEQFKNFNIAACNDNVHRFIPIGTGLSGFVITGISRF
jgi:hypothetical protein